MSLIFFGIYTSKKEYNLSGSYTLNKLKTPCLYLLYTRFIVKNFTPFWCKILDKTCVICYNV